MVYFLKALFFVTLCHAFSLQARSAANILNDLKSADSDTNKISHTVQTFGQLPNPPSGPTLAMYVSQLETDLHNCTVDSRKTGSITPAAIQPICAYVNGTLYSDTRSMLNYFLAKKSEFNAAGFHGVIVADLQQLRNYTAGCLTSIGSKGSSTSKPQCGSAASNYDKLYASALAGYGNS